MIIPTADLPGLRGKVTMVDGGFDPLHTGHVEYFRAAAKLDAPVLCNVSPDTWIERKHTPLLPQEDRARIIDAIRYIDYTHLSTDSTETVLRTLQPRFYVKGSDWRGRLPAEEEEACASSGTEIVYLETVLNSSTNVLRDFVKRTLELEATSPAAIEHQQLVDLRMQALVEIDQPLVLISQLPRSGGTLLLRLFDGHSACHVYPLEMAKFLYPDQTFARGQRAWEDLFDRKLLRIMARQGHYQAMAQLNEDRDRYPLLVPPLVQQVIFQRLLRRVSEPKGRQVLDCFATSFFNAWLDNRNLRGATEKRWVVGFAPGVHANDRNRARFQDLYPDGRGISIIRDPWSWFVSARRWSARWKDRDVAIQTWIEATEGTLAWKRDQPDSVEIVAFDRLLNHTRPTMRQLAHFLELEPDQTLTAPTLNGLPAKANSSFATQGHSVSKDPLSRQQDLSEVDASWITEQAGALYEEVRDLALPARRSTPPST